MMDAMTQTVTTATDTPPTGAITTEAGSPASGNVVPEPGPELLQRAAAVRGGPSYLSMPSCENSSLHSCLF